MISHPSLPLTFDTLCALILAHRSTALPVADLSNETIRDELKLAERLATAFFESASPALPTGIPSKEVLQEWMKSHYGFTVDEAAKAMGWQRPTNALRAWVESIAQTLGLAPIHCGTITRFERMPHSVEIILMRGFDHWSIDGLHSNQCCWSDATCSDWLNAHGFLIGEDGVIRCAHPMSASRIPAYLEGLPTHRPISAELKAEINARVAVANASEQVLHPDEIGNLHSKVQREKTESEADPNKPVVMEHYKGRPDDERLAAHLHALLSAGWTCSEVSFRDFSQAIWTSPVISSNTSVSSS